MVRDYTAALLQMDFSFGSVEENVARATEKIREAAAAGARLICLPEGFHTGYLATHIHEMVALVETAEGPTIQTMRSLAKELEVFLLAPIILRGTKDNSTEFSNTAFLIDDQGEIVGTYAKSHLISGEVDHFTPGSDYPVWDTKLGRIGILICYDICFPETSRILALQGAEIILCPSAWRNGSYFLDWWNLNLRTRALDNLVYCLGVNRVGECGVDVFAGSSQIIGPTGTVLAQASETEERILYGDVHLDELVKAREQNTVLQDRRPWDYSLLTERKCL